MAFEEAIHVPGVALNVEFIKKNASSFGAPCVGPTVELDENFRCKNINIDWIRSLVSFFSSSSGSELAPNVAYQVKESFPAIDTHRHQVSFVFSILDHVGGKRNFQEVRVTCAGADSKGRLDDDLRRHPRPVFGSHQNI